MQNQRFRSASKHPRRTILGCPISSTATAWLDIEGEMSIGGLDRLLEILVVMRNEWAGDEHDDAVRAITERALVANG